MLQTHPKPTVLVVEDDRPFRIMLRNALQAAGFTVVAVEDGLSALQRIEAEPPQVVVLDLALPRLSGRDVYRELAARPETSQIPVVIVSGADDVDDLNPSEFAGVLRKPVQPEAVIEAVESGLRHMRHRAASI